MVKLELTSILFSQRNYDLAYRLHKSCLKMCMNLVTCLNFVELTIKVAQLNPDIVFCDLTTVDLSSSNIQLMLENKEYKNTKIVFVGNYKHKKMLENLCLNQFEFVLEEDIDDFLINHIDIIKFNAYDNKQEREDYVGLFDSVAYVLNSLGFSPKHTGYSYLTEIIINIVKEDGVVNSLIGNLYPPIAVKFKTTSCNIERNIRNAITCAYNKTGLEIWNKIFKEQFFIDNKKPTNREFICMCSQMIINSLRKKSLKQSYI